MTGIYKITSPTNKIYIGQSHNTEKRFYQYKSLRCKDQSRIYNSLKKHGVNNHLFDVICEINKDAHQLIYDYSEQFFMDAYSAMGYELMNLRGGGSRGRFSEEAKRKLSLSLKGKNTWSKGLKRNEEQRKAISERVKKWHHDNGRVLKPKIKVKKERLPFPEHLKERYRNERSGDKNHFFGKTHTEETRRIISENNKLKLTGTNNGRARAIIQYDLNGNFIKEWDTVTNASKSLNINRLTISSALSGDNKTAKGFIFKYKTPK